MKRIQTCLWFDRRGEEAAAFYVSVFKNSKIIGTTRYGESGAQATRMPKGSVMTVTFELDGHPFMALNGGPMFRFTEAISLVVLCKDQKEIDEYWWKLSQGGEESVCGWLKDKFGLSWQIVPAALQDWMLDEDSEKTERLMAAVMTMKKLDLAALKKAYKGK